MENSELKKLEDMGLVSIAKASSSDDSDRDRFGKDYHWSATAINEYGNLVYGHGKDIEESLINLKINLNT